MENPFLRGRLYSSNDPGAIPNAMASGFTVIALVDVGNSLQYPNCAIMSSLLPPPDSITDIINGNVPLGIQRYMVYLGEPAREDTIVCILAALYQKPCNFLLYTEYDADREFHILETISGFFANVFGIVIGSYMNPRMPAYSVSTPQFEFTIADLLFVNGFISAREYARMMPPRVLPSPRACSVLLRNINYGFKNMEDCAKACVGMLNDIRKEMQTGKQCPVLIVPPNLTKDALDELRNRKVNQMVMNVPPVNPHKVG
jgi:hypothetical protein